MQKPGGDWAPRQRDPDRDSWEAFPKCPGFSLSFSEATGCWSHDGRVVVQEEGFRNERVFLIDGAEYRLVVGREAVEDWGGFIRQARFRIDGVTDLIESPDATRVARAIGGHRWRQPGTVVFSPGFGWLSFPVFGGRFGGRKKAVMQCRQQNGQVLIRYRESGRWDDTELVLDPNIPPEPRTLALAVMTRYFLPDFFQPDH